jgi:hypothetical protein
MRTRTALLPTLTVALLGAPGVSAQAAFEGVITYRMSMEGHDATMRYMAKGTNLRQEMEMPGMPGPMFILLDLEHQVARTVMPSMGMYMEMDLAKAQEMLPPEARAKAESPPPLVKLGTSDVVAGVHCENYRIGEDMEACIATGLGWFMNAPQRGMGRGTTPTGPNFRAYEKEFKDGALPLRMRYLRNAKWELLMEATAVEKKSLDASLFELPAGLRKMGMPGR